MADLEDENTRNKLKQSFAKIGSYFFVFFVAIVMIVIIFFAFMIMEFIHEFDCKDEALDLISEFLKSTDKSKHIIPVARMIESL